MDEQFTVDLVPKHLFLRLAEEIDNWQIYHMAHCTKGMDSWSTPVMHTNGVRIDKVSLACYF
jgi:hypothetical protein